MANLDMEPLSIWVIGIRLKEADSGASRCRETQMFQIFGNLDIYVFSLCVIVFVLAVAGGPENVWAAAKKYFGPRDLLQTMLTSFFLSKKGWSSSPLQCSIFLK